jgi:hypothetical protein
VRVSTLDQNEVRQLEGRELDKVFTDKASGKDVKRPQLEAMLGFVREGDTLYCHSMDRLARNLDDLCKIVLGPRGTCVLREGKVDLYRRRLADGQSIVERNGSFRAI